MRRGLKVLEGIDSRDPLALGVRVVVVSIFVLVWSALLGISIFGETLRPAVVVGAALVVAAGLFTLWRERRQG